MNTGCGNILYTFHRCCYRSLATSKHLPDASRKYAVWTENQSPFSNLKYNNVGGVTSLTFDAGLSQFRNTHCDVDTKKDILCRGYEDKAKSHLSEGLPIIHHVKYVSEFPIKHRFCMRKFHAVFRYLRMDQVISVKQVVEPWEVSQEECELVHSKDYIHKVFTGLTSDREQRVSGFKWSPGIISRCRYEAGGTILACHLALERGVACSTGGGTHHAFFSHGSGYCLINDMAIAAASIIASGRVDRVLIVDLDVHQGDGTASLLQLRDDIFTLSFHCGSNFPFTKQNSDLDISLKDHINDDEYLSELEDVLPYVVDTFRPDLVIYDAGVDPHKDDELGRLDLTDDGLYRRDKYVIDHLAIQGIPVATVIGGGYSRSLNILGRRHTIVHRAASQVWREREL